MFRKLKLFWHLDIGVVLILAGVNILTPVSWVLLLRAFLATHFNLGVSTSSPPSTGWTLLGLGLAFCVFGELWRIRQAKHSGRLIVFRHCSMSRAVSRITREVLTGELAGSVIEEVDCDLSELANPQDPHIALAIKKQLGRIAHFKSQERTSVTAAIGYYGIAHVPLVFAAGYELSSTAHLHLFEHDSKRGEWAELDPTGTPLGVYAVEVSNPPTALDVAIRISVSFAVQREDIVSCLSTPFIDLHIAIPTPRRGAVHSYDQVRDVASRFRGLLDAATNRIQRDGIIHIFYAGPVPLAFCLGQQISRSIHRTVKVYNYTAEQVPCYSWNIAINR